MTQLLKRPRTADEILANPSCLLSLRAEEIVEVEAMPPSRSYRPLRLGAHWLRLALLVVAAFVITGHF